MGRTQSNILTNLTIQSLTCTCILHSSCMLTLPLFGELHTLLPWEKSGKLSLLQVSGVLWTSLHSHWCEYIVALVTIQNCLFAHLLRPPVTYVINKSTLHNILGELQKITWTLFALVGTNYYNYMEKKQRFSRNKRYTIHGVCLTLLLFCLFI